MALYEYRDRDGRARERVRAVTGSHEDTRLGLAVLNREKAKGKAGWHLVDETPTAAPAPPAGDTTRG